MSFQRSSGILLHPTSLPGSYGIGDLGPEAHRFVDFLAEAGNKLWQVLPLGPTGYGDSPYQCFSAFAGNPFLVSPDFLIRDGFLQSDDLEQADFPAGARNPGRSRRVDYGRIIPWKLNLLERAWRRFASDPGAGEADFDRFAAEEAPWLDDFALFMAVKEAYGGGAWSDWPGPLRLREPSALAQARAGLADSIARHKFIQFLFFKQWRELLSLINAWMKLKISLCRSVSFILPPFEISELITPDSELY